MSYNSRVHILIQTSFKEKMLTQIDNLLQSLRRAAYSNPITIVVVDNKPNEQQPLFYEDKEKEKTIRQKLYLFPHVEIYFCNLSYNKVRPQIRWHIEPKEKICLFLDTDILFFEPLQTLLDNYKPNNITAVSAYSSLLSVNEWNNIYKIFQLTPNFAKTPTGLAPREYINYGVLLTDSDVMKKIKTNIDQFVQNLLELESNTIKKYAPQIALAITIQKQKIPINFLDESYNYLNTPGRPVPKFAFDLKILHLTHDFNIKQLHPDMVSKLPRRITSTNANFKFL